MSNHFKNVCKHGKTMGQCRCSSPGKTITLVECSGHSDLAIIWVEPVGTVLIGSAPEPPSDLESAIAFMRRVSPVTHEPLATLVAEEWAEKLIAEGWTRRNE